jgi:DNA-binding response OmpR family regulator
MNDEVHRSILLIEDEPLLAMDVEMTLGAAGFHVMGPADTNEAAFALLRAQSPDLTVLDLNLGSELAVPVFDYLAERDKPFIILSGHSRQLVPARHQNRPFLQKPYQTAALLRLVHETLAAANGASLFNATKRRVMD